MGAARGGSRHFDHGGRGDRRAALDRRAPKLVVLLVIDQFRQDFLTRFRPFFGTGDSGA